MPRMKPQTMTWSLRLSRWKHMVETSLSAAPLQMGRDCDRQKLRLHWPQGPAEDPPWARRGWDLFLMPIVSSSAAAIISSSSEGKLRASWSSSAGAVGLVLVLVSPPDGGLSCDGGLGAPPGEDFGFISMIVLFVKQVHLQNVGAVAATAREAKAPKKRMRKLSRCIFVLSRPDYRRWTVKSTRLTSETDQSFN